MKERCFALPRMSEMVLENGLRVIVIPGHEQEGLVVALQMPFGRFSDPPGQEGCAEMCVGLMQKGTAKSGFEEFSDTFEHHGAAVFADVGEEQTMLGVKMLARFRDRLFPLFWDMVTSPCFDSREFSRIQQEMITALRAETVDPGAIANRHFFHELAGREHPAGRFYTLQSVRRLKRDHLTGFYRRHIMPQNGTLVIAGDVPDEWFDRCCRTEVEKWRCGGSPSFCEAVPAVQHGRVVRFVEKSDLSQVSLLVGQAAPGELDPHRTGLALANYVFGAGNFSSRLMTRIRSTGGNTYAISSHIAAERRFGALTISTSTQNRQVGEVLAAVIDEYRTFCNLGITPEELERAKRFAIGNMAFQLEGITNIVEKTLWLRFYHRTNEYIETFDEMIRAVSFESVNETVRKCLDPEKLIVVAVGNGSEVLPQLSSFGNPRKYHYKDRFA